jgi:hypothetical protein
VAANETLLHAARRLVGRETETADVDLVRECPRSSLLHWLA